MTEVISVRMPFGTKETIEEHGKVREVLEALAEGLEEGSLVFDGRLYSYPDTGDFVKACKKHGEDPERILKMVAEQLWSN